MISDSSNFRCVADALGLGTLSDGEPSMDPELLQALYRHARNEDGQRALFTNDPSFKKGWVNLDSSRGQELVAAFVPLDDAENLKQARRYAQINLEAQPWNDLLGIEHLPIVCKVKIHGAKWGIRFQSAQPVMRGQEILNEDLPPIPVGMTGDVDSGSQRAPIGKAPTTDPEPSSTSASGTSAATAAMDALRRGGLPA